MEKSYQSNENYSSQTQVDNTKNKNPRDGLRKAIDDLLEKPTLIKFWKSAKSFISDIYHVYTDA